jgi:hypothetical protein
MDLFLSRAAAGWLERVVDAPRPGPAGAAAVLVLAPKGEGVGAAVAAVAAGAAGLLPKREKGADAAGVAVGAAVAVVAVVKAAVDGAWIAAGFALNSEGAGAVVDGVALAPKSVFAGVGEATPPRMEGVGPEGDG